MVAGNQQDLDMPVDIDVRGSWTLTASELPSSLSVKLSGTASKPSMKVTTDSVSIPATFSLRDRRLNFTLTTDTLGLEGVQRASALADSILVNGTLVLSDGRSIPFVMRRDEPHAETKKDAAPGHGGASSSARYAPLGSIRTG